MQAPGRVGHLGRADQDGGAHPPKMGFERRGREIGADRCHRSARHGAEHRNGEVRSFGQADGSDPATGRAFERDGDRIHAVEQLGSTPRLPARQGDRSRLRACGLLCDSTKHVDDP